MKRPWLCTALVILFCSIALSSSATAQDKKFTERYRLPSVQTNAAGDKCLNAEQWDRVILIASEYRGLYDWRLEIMPALTLHGEVVEDLERVIKARETQIKLLQGDRDYLKSRVLEEHQFALDIQKSEKMSVLGWKITAGVGWAGVLALAITALAVN
jgi:hypothetical protein